MSETDRASELHGRPSAAELVAAVAEFLDGEVRSATTGAVNFHARAPGGVGEVSSASIDAMSASARSPSCAITGPWTPRTPAAYAHASSAVASENPTIGLGSARRGAGSRWGNRRMMP